ncbi:MAG: hypothetical protein KAJ19_03275 [Gammaproteobacteria bacterium]|nr:hypothetical protein [Gammaproteobacteria bacterium]
MNISEKEIKYVEKLKRLSDKRLAKIADLKMERVEDKRRVAELEHVVKRFGEWYTNDETNCPSTEHDFCPDSDGYRADHEKENLEADEEDRFEFDQSECGVEMQGKCWAKYYAKEWRDR